MKEAQWREDNRSQFPSKVTTSPDPWTFYDPMAHPKIQHKLERDESHSHLFSQFFLTTLGQKERSHELVELGYSVAYPSNQIEIQFQLLSSLSDSVSEKVDPCC